MASKQPKNASPANGTKLKARKLSRTRKPNADRHVKINGRDRRIRLPVSCAGRVFELTDRLGNRTAGRTVEWLMMQAEPSVNAVLSAPIVSSPVETKPFSLIPPHSATLASPVAVGPPPGFAAKTGAVKPKPVLPPFKYGAETEMEFSDEEIAKFFPASMGK